MLLTASPRAPNTIGATSSMEAFSGPAPVWGRKTWKKHGKIMEKSWCSSLPKKICWIMWNRMNRSKKWTDHFSLRLLPTGIKTKSQPDPSDSTSIKSSSRACAWFSMCRCGRTKPMTMGQLRSLQIAGTLNPSWRSPWHQHIYYFDGWIMLNPHSLLNLRCWWLTPRSSWWNHFEWSKSPTPVYTIAIAHKIKTNPPEIPESQVLILKIHIMSDMSDVLSWFSQGFFHDFPMIFHGSDPHLFPKHHNPRERRTSRRRPCLAINLAQMPRSIARRAASKFRFIQKVIIYGYGSKLGTPILGWLILN